MTQYIFNPDYLSFVSNMITQQSVESDKVENISKAQFSTMFLLAVALRAKNKEQVPMILNFVKACCGTNLKHCKRIATLFSYPEIIQEFLIYCPYGAARRWSAELLKCVMERLYLLEREQLISLGQKGELLTSTKEFCKLFDLTKASISNKVEIKEIKVPHLWLLMDALMQQILTVFTHGNPQYFQLFCFFARLGPEARRLLNRGQMFGVTFEYLKSSKDACVRFVSAQMVHLELKEQPVITLITKDPSRETKKLLRRTDSQPFTFELMYWLVLNAEIQRSKATELKVDSFITKLSATEDNYITSLKETETIKFLISTCENNKAATTFFSKTMAYIAFDNEEYIKKILLYTLGRLGNLDCASLKPIFSLVYFLLDNQDSYPNKSLNFIENFFSYFEKNQNSYRVETFIDFFIKICRNNNVFLAFFRNIKSNKRSTYIELMENWLNANPYPTYNPSVICSSKSSVRYLSMVQDH
jgi:hypothetical protein